MNDAERIAAEQLAAGLNDGQRRALSVPHLLVIDNFECVPDMGWPREMIVYQWPYYDALSDTGLAVRTILEQANAK
jgi:hypothetical protein